MVWYLLLAHFLGDFVLQTDRMVRMRDKLWFSSLHAGIHFLLMFLLAGSYRMLVWPYLLLLAFLHFVQDRIKNSIVNRRPDWLRVSFVIDQFLHYLTPKALEPSINRFVDKSLFDDAPKGIRFQKPIQRPNPEPRYQAS